MYMTGIVYLVIKTLKIMKILGVSTTLECPKVCIQACRHFTVEHRSGLNIPPTRPVILIQDGHSSGMIELMMSIYCAYQLTLPISSARVFKSFKAYFSKAGSAYLFKRDCSHDIISGELVMNIKCYTYKLGSYG